MAKLFGISFLLLILYGYAQYMIISLIEAATEGDVEMVKALRVIHHSR
jgi:hypothetical protein